MEVWEGFWYGVFGGSLGELLKWWNIKDELKEKGLPQRFKHLGYVGLVVAMAVVGGIFVKMYIESGAVINAFMAVHIGAATPLIMAGMMRETPSVSPGTVD